MTQPTNQKHSLLTILQTEYSAFKSRLSRERVAQRLLTEPRVDLEFYIKLLKYSYHYVARTAPWLRDAAQRTQNPRLAELLGRKAKEEQGHELAILADLDAMGCDVSAPEKWPLVPGLAAYNSWHDFVIREIEPGAILGAAYILERNSTNAGVLARRLQAQGLPRKFASFMWLHAEADNDHVRELEEAIVKLERNIDFASQVILSAKVTSSAYIGLLRSIVV